MTTYTKERRPPAQPCSRCGKPVEPLWTDWGKKWHFFQHCDACEKVDHDESMKRIAKEDAEKRLVQSGLSDPYFRRLSVNMFKKDSQARAQVADKIRPLYQEFKRKKVMGNLFLSGPAGTGKTLVAVGLCHEALNQGMNVKLAVVPELILMLRTRILNGLDGDIANLCAQDVLCLDDMGAEKTTEWVAETLYVIIDKWYRSEKQGLIITSNLPLGDLSARFGDRLASRIAGMCTVVDFGGCKDGRLK